MTIAFLTASVSRKAGGLYDAVRCLAVEQAALDGCLVLVFGLEDCCTLTDLPGWQGLPVQTAAVRGPRSFGYAPQLLRSLAAGHPDLLHQHGIWMYPSVACRRWATRTGKPYIVSPHGMLDRWALGNSAWKKRLAGWLYEDRNLRGAACLHALNESEMAAMRAYGLRNPICVIPNGVDLPPSHGFGGQGREEERRERGEKRLVFLGRLHPKKGLPALLRAWARVRPKGWRLVVAGWDQGGHEAEMKRLAGTLGVAEQVEFAGPKFGAEKDALFRGADGFVLPSYSEGLPVAVLEAWSYGLPVVMTPECNLPEGFAAGAAVRITANEEGVAAGLEELAGMGETELRAMGMRGRKLVEERFTWRRISLDMAGVYEWVLGRGPRPGCVSLD